MSVLINDNVAKHSRIEEYRKMLASALTFAEKDILRANKFPVKDVGFLRSHSIYCSILYFSRREIYEFD